MNYYIILISIVVAMGGFTFGVDSGIIATTLGHETFAIYMFGPSAKNAALTGAIYYCIMLVKLWGHSSLDTVRTNLVVDGRFVELEFWASLTDKNAATIGSALQSGAQEVGMMIAGRFLAGLARGIILSVVPVYIAEVSPPKSRGFIVGLQGMMISGGFHGCVFIPYTPRWLIEKERYDEAQKVILRLHGDQGEDFVSREFTQIKDQIMLEREGRSTNFMVAISNIFSRRYIRRTSTACFILMMGQLSGSIVIQNYQSIFYAAVGYTRRTRLLISGIYGFMGVFGQIAYLFIVADRWPRTRTLWTGSAFLCIMINILIALSAEFPSGTTSISGPRPAIAFIFIYSFGYALFFNAMVWVVPVELFPFFLRSKGLGLAVFAKAITAIVLSQITPLAIQNVGWRYYALFIATNFAAAFVYFFWLPETKGKSLEEIAELCGDALATERLDEMGSAGEKVAIVEMSTSKHVESV